MYTLPEKLLAGYRDFLANRFNAERELYSRLARQKQTPQTMVIACCDSRSAPETIFNAGHGELFVLRNVANLVPPFEPDGGQHGTSAAIEYAVTVLHVQNILVMGHGNCGGIHAALNPDTSTPAMPRDFVARWMNLLEPVTRQFPDNGLMTAGERQTILERISIRNSISNLRTFPCVRELERNGKLAVHGAWFDISSGELWVMDSDSGEFERIETSPAPEPAAP